MIRPRPSKDSLHLFALVAAVVTIAALYFARIILIPLALALLFTFILTPLVKALERAHFGRIPSTLLVVALSVVVFGAVGWSVAMQFSEVVNQLPQYKSSIRTKLQSLHLASNHTLDNASQTMTDLSRDLASSPTPSRGGEAEFPATKARPSEQARPTQVEVVKSPALPLESLESVLVLLGSALIVVVFTIFMLIRREDLRDRLISLAGEERLHTITQALDDASARVSRYLLLETLVNAGYGIFIGVCLHFIGVPGAPLWGAIAGLFRFLPYIGPPLGALMPLLLSLAVFSSWKGPLLTFSLFVITEIVVSNLLEPVLYGAHTGLSSLAILVAAIFWTSLWGPVGLILSTPLTVCLVVLGRYFPQLTFLHVLLGDQPVLSPDSRFYQRLLATDYDEGRRVLEKYLEENSLQDLYDSVFIPALGLAEQDRHQNRLDEATETFIWQSARELIDEFAERAGESAQAKPEGDGEASGAARAETARTYKVVCLPARDEADEIVALMLAQLLERAGFEIQSIPLGTAAEMVALTKEEKPDVICISALPPFAIPHVRALYAKLCAQLPDVRVDVGLWGFSGDPLKIDSRLGLKEGSRAFSKLGEFIEGLTRAESRGDAGVVEPLGAERR